MNEFLLTGLIGIALIAICGFNIYELLRLVWRRLPDMRAHPRMRVLLVVGAVFMGHIINIWIFGAVYYALIQLGLGNLAGAAIERGDYPLDLFGCVYFSAVIYTTVGLGDITPEGWLRMITGVQGLTGFIMIGWTVSFTYLAMEKFWELPHRHRKTHS
jgi:hypothetical protein